MNLETLKDQFGEGILEADLKQGQGVVRVTPEKIHEVLKHLKENSDHMMNILLDVVAVDYLGEDPRFEVVYILYSVPLKHRMRLKVRVAEGKSLPTASDLWNSADWAEREVWDMYGIKFAGHSNLKRILMFEGFDGHPLRKDYPIGKRQKIPEIEEIP